MEVDVRIRRLLSHLGREGRVPLVTVHFGDRDYLVPFVRHCLAVAGHLFFMGDARTASFSILSKRNTRARSSTST